MSHLVIKIILSTQPQKRQRKGSSNTYVMAQAYIPNSGDQQIILGLISVSQSIDAALLKYQQNDLLHVAGELTNHVYLKAGLSRAILQLNVEAICGVNTGDKAVQTKLKPPVEKRPGDRQNQNARGD